MHRLLVLKVIVDIAIVSEVMSIDRSSNGHQIGGQGKSSKGT